MRTGLAGFSSIPPVWYSFNILTKSAKFHPWFGCVEGSALNPVKVLKNLQFLYFLGLKLKITFLRHKYKLYTKKYLYSSFQINKIGRKSSLQRHSKLWNIAFLRTFSKRIHQIISTNFNFYVLLRRKNRPTSAQNCRIASAN